MSGLSIVPINGKTDSVVRRPSKSFKFGSVVIPYQKYQRGRYSYYMLFYYDNGRRRIETRSNFAQAEKRAEQISKSIQRGELAMLHFSEAQRASFLRCLEILKGTNVPPELACSYFVKWIGRCAGDPGRIDEHLTFSIENRPRVAISKNVADVCDEMLAQMERDKAGQRWIDDLRSRLTPTAKKWKQPVKPFTQHFDCPIHELRAPAISAWIDDLALAPRTRNNYRTAILTLVAFAKKKTYLPRSWTEMAEVESADDKRGAIRIYTPDQLAALLGHCAGNFLPFLAIKAFAGLRTCELHGGDSRPRLDWSDVKLEKRLIYVPKEVAKERTPDRLVPISENLAAWLVPYARRNGPICTLANVTNALRRTAKRAKVPLHDNGLRKSFISYRLALVKDIGQVADEAGNSPSIIKTNYRRPIEETEAQRWFAINPADSDILQLSLALK
jgi:integrase